MLKNAQYSNYRKFHVIVLKHSVKSFLRNNNSRKTKTFRNICKKLLVELGNCKKFSFGKSNVTLHLTN